MTSSVTPIVEAVRRFVQQEVVPLESSIPNGASLEPAMLADLRRRARHHGVWSIGAPTSLGGYELGAIDRCLIVEEMSRTSVSGGWLGSGIFGEVGPNLLEIVGTESQIERYLRPVVEDGDAYFFAMTEPGAGSDPSAMSTTARSVDGGWVLDGRKGLIGYVEGASFGFVFAVAEPTSDQPGGVTCFLVERSNPGMVHADATTSHAGIPVGYIDLTECFVPDECVVGDVGAGLRLGQRWLGQMRTVYYGAMMLGLASRALEMAVEHAANRSTFGRTLSERENIQFAVADAATDITVTRLLVHDTARRLDRGDVARAEVAMVKVVGTEMASRVIDSAIQIHGGIGLTPLLPLEQMLRTARSYRVTEGPNEVHRWSIAREIFRGSTAFRRGAGLIAESNSV